MTAIVFPFPIVRRPRYRPSGALLQLLFDQFAISSRKAGCSQIEVTS